ncbi:MFS general substrate transporter [Bisporella sp. PMI_857]|nr:MFS general substrate transporter [Bisporella sp. PMI_857]
MFNFAEKTVLANASVYGLVDDIDLSGNHYAWVAGAFYIGYLALSYPSTFPIQTCPVGTYISFSLLAWGIIVALTSACTSYEQLLLTRFLTGALESSVSPAFLYITNMWYTRDEVPSRIGIWFAGYSCGGAMANLLSWGAGHIQESFKSWRWLYIIFGCTTVCWSLILFVFLPSNIQESKFFTPVEKDIIESRVAASSTGITSTETENEKWDAKEAFYCMLDLKTWLFFLIALFGQIPNGGFQAFANLVIKGFGFTSFQSSILVVPVSVLGLIIVLLTGYLATKFERISTLMIALLAVPPLIGNLVMLYSMSRWVKLAAYYMIPFGYGIIPLNMSLIGGNVRGVTRKMTTAAMMLIAFCAGNIIGPHLFLKSEAPYYHTSFKLVAISYGAAALSSVALRLYLDVMNRRWEVEERSPTPIIQESGAPSPVLEIEPATVAREVKSGFRYRL